jgi:hypothetical protein
MPLALGAIQRKAVHHRRQKPGFAGYRDRPGTAHVYIHHRTEEPHEGFLRTRTVPHRETLEWRWGRPQGKNGHKIWPFEGHLSKLIELRIGSELLLSS